MREVHKASSALCAWLALFITGCPTTYVVLSHDGGVGAAARMQPAGEGGAGAGGVSGYTGGYSSGGAGGGTGGVGGCWDGACGGVGGCAIGGAGGCDVGGAGGCGFGGTAGCDVGRMGGVGGGPACDPSAGGMAANNCAMSCGEPGDQHIADDGTSICTVLVGSPCELDCIYRCDITPDDPRCFGNVGGMVAAGMGGIGGMAGTVAGGTGGMAGTGAAGTAGCDTSDPACEPVQADAGVP